MISLETLTLLALMLIVLTLKSTPIVAACSGSNASSVNRKSNDDLPTPLSPIIRSFKVVKIESPSIFQIILLRAPLKSMLHLPQIRVQTWF